MYKRYGKIYREKTSGVYLINIHLIEDIEVVMKAQGKYPLRIINEANVYRRKSLPHIYNSVGLVDS